jgi:uracil phosphoribosyltransferase
MPFVTAVEHPLVKHHLARLRNRQTPPAEFRAVVQRLTVLLAYEATSDLRLQEVEVHTPLTAITGQVLQQRIGVVPILRAGLGMVDPLLDLIPDAEVWHLGLYRDEATAQPVEYYSKLPAAGPVHVALVLDPMLATGGSAASALAALQRWGVPTMKLLSLIAAPEGIAALEAQFPEAQVYVCAVDDRLNDQKFIVPGLGDAGDRSFNTTAADTGEASRPPR